MTRIHELELVIFLCDSASAILTCSGAEDNHHTPFAIHIQCLHQEQ